MRVAIDHIVDPPSTAEAGHHRLSYPQALLVRLEALSPVERAVLMLREAFGYGYPDVARITGKTGVSCRQIFARARQRIAAGRQARDVVIRVPWADQSRRHIFAAARQGSQHAPHIAAMLAELEEVASAKGGGAVGRGRLGARRRGVTSAAIPPIPPVAAMRRWRSGRRARRRAMPARCVLRARTLSTRPFASVASL